MMNKRLLLIYTAVFVLTGLMLHLYRNSYRDMKVFIDEVNLESKVLVNLERLDALLHFWLNNERNITSAMDLYMRPDVAYDSILVATERIKSFAGYQEQRLRMDSIRREVRAFQRLDEKGDRELTPAVREEFRTRIKSILTNAHVFAKARYDKAGDRLEKSTALLDRWFLLMLVLAGTLIIIATFISFRSHRQRERTEGFNRKLLDTTDNGILSFTPQIRDGTIERYDITYCNEAGKSMLGIDDWWGRRLLDLVPKGIYADVRAAFDDVYKTGSTKVLEGYLQDGTERKWLRANIIPLHEGLLVSVYDLTQEKTFQQRLTYKVSQLEVANDELQQYAYVTSHDLQEPLRKIQMFADIGLNLKNGTDSNSKDEYFRKVQGIAGHMRDLIQTLLAFTRSTDRPEHFQKVNLNELINEVIAELELRENGITIHLPNLPELEGSPVHLKLLFSNLLSNSLKYARADVPLEIAFSERKLKRRDYIRYPNLSRLVRYICISVSDNGIGFKPEMNEKIFTIFQRLHLKENASGAGIGLAICRKVVHQHQGYMFAEGKLNQGATFHIILPLRQPADSK